ncbi:MAG: TlyA family RNA methyltransferase [Chthonomonadales bacterium]|nr:TlyA family RNA methyltransferase [Chthonomonadales bacterium]
MPERLDRLVTARGLAPSRERAQMLIAAGLVEVDGERAAKASQLVEETAEVVVTGEAIPYVGRGGLKLEAALRHFRVNAREAVCLDIGASTGGFTDCLLQRGARHVVALDVGHGQLAPSLQVDPRVELRERVNARYLSPEQFAMPFDLVAIDVSFISLTLILPAAAPALRPGGHVLALVKPEFEAGRDAVGPGGVVRDPEARKRAIQRVIRCAVDELGLDLRGTMLAPSPRGRAGNREYFACFRRPVERPDVPANAGEPGPEGGPHTDGEA